MALVACIVIAACAWLSVRGLAAKAELQAAMPIAASVKSEVLAGDWTSASASVKAMAARTAKARELTSDPIWRAAEIVPVVGANLTAARELAGVIDEVIREGVQPLAGLAPGWGLDSLKPVDGAIALEPLSSAGTAVSESSEIISGAKERVGAIDTSQTLSQITNTVKQFDDLLAVIAPPLATASKLLSIGPDALGASEPRNYVIVFQNNAEARALGGTSLSFTLLTLDKGRLTLGAAIPAGFGDFENFSESVIPLPDGVDALYGTEFGRAVSNVTVRPSFPSAAEVTQEMWKRRFGTDVDGVISVDPLALGYLLRGAAPISLSTGDVLTSETLVPLLLNALYMRYWSGDSPSQIFADNTAQDVVYAEIVQKTFDGLLGGDTDPKLLFTALAQAVSERRLLMWSPHEKEQTAIKALAMDGALPESDKIMDRVGVYFQENVGSKMNYYLKQSVSLGQAACRADGKASYRVGVDLTNEMPADAATSISPSILGTFVREKLEPGVQRMIVMVYAPPGSRIVGATVDGVPVQLESFHDTDYPVAKLIVSMEPGATSKITLDVVAAGTGKKALEAQITPMVNPTTISDLPLDCATVAAG